MHPLIYVAGPYRAASREAVAQNIDAARQIGAAAAAIGWYPVIPHANTAHMELNLQHDDEFWLRGTLELMTRCDAVVLVPGWQNSAGTLGEIAKADSMQLPIFRTIDDLPSASAFHDWACCAPHRTSAFTRQRLQQEQQPWFATRP